MTARYFAKKIYPLAAAVSVGAFIFLKLTEKKK